MTKKSKSAGAWRNILTFAPASLHFSRHSLTILSFSYKIVQNNKNTMSIPVYKVQNAQVFCFSVSQMTIRAAVQWYIEPENPVLYG